MIARALRRAGLDVLQAESGEEAVALYQQHRDATDVVLLEVQLPGLSGPQTLAALRGSDPAVRCVFMSGDLSDCSVDQLLGLGAAAFLDKPFRELGRVAEVLRQAARDPQPGTDEFAVGEE